MKKNVFRIIMLIIASFIQAIAINLFVTPSNLISSGFNGLSILSVSIFNLFDINLPLSLFVLLYNIPVALICYKSLSKKFVILSMVEIVLFSIFVDLIPRVAVFDDIMLSCIFGGVLNGTAIVIALKANASTGGTDFIAQYVSNKIQKSIFNYVLAFNIMLVVIFGFINGWQYAGYSIVYQFISTHVINTLYHRYDRITLQVVTAKADEVCQEYFKRYRHGMSIIDIEGGYKHQKMKMLNTVVSVYEKNEICSLIKEIDEKAIINIFKTDDFYGGFYIKPIE